MFDIGFFELILIAVIGLVVLGPERLPQAARALGRWVGKAKKLSQQFSNELERQIELEEIKASLRKQGEQLDFDKEAQQIQQSVRAALNEAENHDYEPLPRTEPDQAFTEQPAAEESSYQQPKIQVSYGSIEKKEPRDPPIHKDDQNS